MKLDHAKVPSHKVLSFLKSVRFLRRFSIREDFREIWSPEVFQAIAEHESLSDVEVPEIPETWIESLGSKSKSCYFPTMKDLKTRLSEAGLQAFQPFMQDVTAVELRISGQSTRALEILANCPCLTSLKLQYGIGSVIRGIDLIQISKKCNMLECLQVPMSDDYPQPSIPFSDGVTNATIELMACGLPRLRNLHLSFGNTDLTEVSLISLGTRCRFLEECYLSADIFFQDLVKKCGSNLFPALEALYFSQPVSNRRHYEDVEETANRFVNTAPKLETFQYLTLDNLTDEDYTLEGCICDLVDDRFHSVRNKA